MLSFIHYIELFEAKVDDLAAKHPEHADAIREYNKADPTPTKKFLPWLVKQHMAGNVTPQDARLGSTLSHFEKVAHKLPSGKDHNAYDFNTLASHVGEHLEAAVKKKQGEQAIEKVYNDPKSGITAQQIRSREASQKLYGGGASRAGTPGCERGTSWCVAARSKNNMFGHYGPTMYTIHDPNDDAAPYAIHPTNPSRGPVITNRHNNGDIPVEEAIKNKPHLKGPIQSILTHSAYQLPKLMATNDVDVIRGALAHPMVAKEHLATAADHSDPQVRRAVAQHRKATPQQISKALEDSDPLVRSAAAANPSLNAEHLRKALSDPDKDVVTRAVEHPLVSAEDLLHVAQNREMKGQLRYKVLNHPNLTDDVREKILADRSSAENREDAMRSPNASPKELAQGLKDTERNVRYAAARHPNLTPELLHMGLKDEDAEVRREIARHPNHTPETLLAALDDRSERAEAARAAAAHSNATTEVIAKAQQHPNSIVRAQAAIHPRTTPEQLEVALKDKDKWVRSRALENINIKPDQIHHALQHDPEADVRYAAVSEGLRVDPDNASRYTQIAVNDPEARVRRHAYEHKSVTADQLTKALKDDDDLHAVGSIPRNPNVTAEHLKSLLGRPLASWNKEEIAKHKKLDSDGIHAALDHTDGDYSYEVRRGAMKNKNATPEHIARGLQDPHKQVRMTALKNKNASAENLMQGLSDKLLSVRVQALKNPNITQEHIQKAANDPDKNVRATAQALLMKK